MHLKYLCLLLLGGSSFLAAQTTGLSFRPNGAVYSTALDRLVFTAGAPNQVHIYDPVSHSDQTVALPEAPQNLSLSADGLYVAVALVDSVSYVSLQSATIVKTFANVPVNGGAAILGSGYIYVSGGSSGNSSGSLTTIQLSNGQIATSSSPNVSGGIFNPTVSAIYSAQAGLYRFNVSGAAVSSGVISADHSGFVCGSLWLSPDNSKIYTGCGRVYSASSDTTKDMLYQGILGSLTSVQGLASSALLNQIAAIPSVNPVFNSNNQTDTQVDLFDSSYYNLMGVFQTNPFTVGSFNYPAHARYVFYNSTSANLFVVTQADTKAGLLMDFAVDSINLQNANSCNAQFSSGSASAIASGTYATTQILSGEDCAFTAVSNVPWITLTAGYYGSGNTALTYLVRPNLTSSARSGTITLGASTFSVTQDAAAAPSSLNLLSFNPVAADYDKALDKIVMVTASPNELHLYDPLSQADQIIPLPGTPLSVSVRPDGLFAAVGGNSSIFYVDLTALTVTKVIPVQMAVGGIMLAGNGYAYALTGQSSQGSSLESVQIATGTVTLSTGYYYLGSIPRLYADGNYIYVAYSNSGVAKFDIHNGTAVVATGAYNTVSGNVWLSEDGTRLINSYGQAYFTSTVASQDLQPNGYLAGTNSIAWAANSQIQHLTALLSISPFGATDNTQLQIYNDNGLQLQNQEAMPAFTVGGTTYVGHGQYLFWNAAETKLFAITQADSTSGLASSFAVNTIAAPGSVPACTYGASPNTIYIPASANFTNWRINVTSNCSWNATISYPSFLLVSSSNNFSPGNGTVSFQPQNPNTGSQRSATITIGNQAVTVVQAASSCTYALASTYAELPLAGGTGTVDLITQSSCPWSVQAGASWLTTATQSGTGPASIQYSVAAGNAYRAGGLNVAGNGFTVTQSGLTSSDPLNFVPVTPCRVADTRNASGNSGGPFIAGTSNRSFNIPASPCNIPSTAAAYSLNVAVVPHGPLGYLTAWAAGTYRPFASTLNSPDGRVKSVAALVPAGTNGAVSFYATNDTDLVLDINGYFVPASTNSGLTYFVLNPCRVADTRNSAGLLGSPFLLAAQQRDLPVQQSSCGIPAEAQAYSLNIAAVPLTGALGYLSLWPSGEPQPATASLNAPTGAVTSNAALLPAGPGGDIEILASNDTHAVIDISGYFAPPASSGLHFYTVDPCRILDTRTSSTPQPFTGVLRFAVGTCNVPSNASAVVVNATVVPSGPLGYLTLWADGQTQPVVATLNASDGAITSNMAIVPMVDGAIDAFASNATHLIVDVAGYFAP